ncbi:hypothetical protein ACNOYE_29590 [Nannocystaceae bacterium ST9]
MRKHHTHTLYFWLAVAGCQGSTSSAPVPSAPDVEVGVCKLPNTSESDWTDLDIENVTHALTVLSNCHIHNRSRYEQILKRYRRAVENWWEQRASAQRQLSGTRGHTANNEINRLESHPLWAWGYIWSASELEVLQKKDRHKIEQMRTSMALDSKPAAFVWTDATLAYALHSPFEEAVSPRMDGRRDLSAALGGLAKALQNEGRLVANSNSEEIGQEFIEQRAAHIIDSVLRISVSDKIDGEIPRELSEAFDGWLAAISSRIPTIYWPTPVLLRLDPEVTLSTREPTQLVSIQQLREDISTFDDGNLAAFFQVRQKEQNWVTTIHERGWFPSKQTNDLFVSEYDGMLVDALRDGLVREFEYIKSSKSIMREAALWIADFRPGRYGDLREVNYSAFEKAVAEAEAKVAQIEEPVKTAQSEIGKWTDLVARAQGVLEKTPKPRKNQPPSPERSAAFTSLRSAQTTLTDWQEELRKENEVLENSKAMLDLARKEVDAAKARLIDASGKEDERYARFLLVSISASETAICLMNVAAFEGLRPADCLSTVPHDAPCIGPRALRPLMMERGGVTDFSSSSYTMAIASRLNNEGLHTENTCHVEMLLNPEFIGRIKLGHEAIRALGLLLNKRLTKLSSQGTADIAEVQPRWKSKSRQTERELNAENEYLASVFASLVTYADADYADACREANYAVPGACNISLYVRELEKLVSGRLTASKDEAHEGQSDENEVITSEVTNEEMKEVEKAQAVIHSLCEVAIDYDGMMFVFARSSADLFTAHGVTKPEFQQLAATFASKSMACNEWEFRLDATVEELSELARQQTGTTAVESL